jgi:hypothetical protein
VWCRRALWRRGCSRLAGIDPGPQGARRRDSSSTGARSAKLNVLLPRGAAQGRYVSFCERAAARQPRPELAADRALDAIGVSG